MTRTPDPVDRSTIAVGMVVPTLREVETTAEAAPARWSALIELRAERPRLPPVRHGLDGQAPVLIGRGPVSEAEAAGRRVLAIDDPRMSRQHVLLTPAGGHSRIEDLGSLNGSLINGEPLRAATLLSAGDVIEVGRTLFVYSEAPAPQEDGDSSLITYSAAYAEQLGRLEAIAPTPVSLLLLGETGTGKEVIACEVHRRSGRTGPYVAVNCGALPDSIVASELFGYKKGAFSGANEDREGLVRSSHGGTLFLDEIADLKPTGQAALLRVLQEREVLMVGGTRPVKVDLRVISATHRDLEALVASGDFRADLLARLAGFTLVLPPLRRRREDLGPLIATLLRRVGPAATNVSLSMKAARALFSHEWPHNVRELEQCLTSAVALARGGAIELEHLPEAVRGGASAPRVEPAPSETPPERRNPRRSEISDELRQTLTQLLQQHRGNVAEIARVMGKKRTQIHRWLARCGLDPNVFRGSRSGDGEE